MLRNLPQSSVVPISKKIIIIKKSLIVVWISLVFITSFAKLQSFDFLLIRKIEQSGFEYQLLYLKCFHLVYQR